MLTATARNVRTTLEMIKIEHTLFALPFALLGAVLAAGRAPTLRQFLLITLAMVGARSCVMAFNRIADREIDARNPRTRSRAIPAGVMSVREAAVAVVIASLVFFVSAWQLNRLCLLLSPLALAWVLFYSYTKRFTRWSHL